jgi:hypothetical protein
VRETRERERLHSPNQVEPAGHGPRLLLARRSPPPNDRSADFRIRKVGPGSALAHTQIAPPPARAVTIRADLVITAPIRRPARPSGVGSPGQPAARTSRPWGPQHRVVRPGGWRARRDSNPRPSDPKSDALSTELRARDLIITGPATSPRTPPDRPIAVNCTRRQRTAADQGHPPPSRQASR